MPRYSKKARVVLALNKVLEERHEFRMLREAMDIEDSVEDELDMMVGDYSEAIQERRYLFRRKYRRGSSHEIFEEDLIDPLDDDNLIDTPSWLSDDQFLKKYRMNRKSLHAIVAFHGTHEKAECHDGKAIGIGWQVCVTSNYCDKCY